MLQHNLEETLKLAKKGDLGKREELIRNHKNFIAKVSSKICNRYLIWNNDDELSIAFLAFNEAIDNFKPSEGTAFHSFAQRIIRNRLIDYFRKESKHMHISLSPMDSSDEELRRYDEEYSYEQYQEVEKQAVLAEVVESYIKVLWEYGVTLDDLVKVSPRHKNRKETLMMVALKLINEPSLLEYLKKYKRLPVKELKLFTGVNRRILDGGRKYLIALALILSEPRFYPLKSLTEIPCASIGEKVSRQ
ncbi:RNA polymerase, sigma 28 subunit, FliA/WhiG subfamily [Desulfofarcimen acetoxidans DSM 771]|uniref:RNA polymerase sigma factor SigI n=1 Tax=Desulfofarcimen acetoxidans (strain ATCC 49208 / DSM 771 / KCTC 5769 / VKM B-1644 / 5575) TaxID=485916 RepID=C8VW91_DESAS|nr:RNA polymerase sigma-I factor [Desulfofarcimen acetoxidans]ACV62443.1 RNA polymerase, sigma 28 subunit, FliA/WhiG subfamily [Desulfofarcimen acetoxidans DSM 771]